MKITKLLFLAIVFANVNADVLINVPYVCSCSQLLTQFDCNVGLGCIWNPYNGICESQPCISLNYNDCQMDRNCAWSYTQNQCNTFSSCSSLIGNANITCYDQSVNCPYQSPSGSCGDFNDLMPCSNQTNYLDCYNKLSQTSCFFDINTQKCVQTSCQNFGSAQNCTYYQYCSWTNYQCSQTFCNNITKMSNCKYVYVYDTKQFQACVWNSVTSSCNPADTTDQLIQNNCTANTVGSYRWNPNSYTCQSCYAKIITIVFLLMILITS